MASEPTTVPSAFGNLLDDLSAAYQRGHPAFNHPHDPTLQRLWRSTCRIEGENGGVGSGFFLNEDYIVTNAHVVDGQVDVTLGRSVGGIRIESFTGRVKLVDYTRDLALVQITTNDPAFSSHPPMALGIGSPPPIGSPILVCGFPHGAATPRLVTGVISGYDMATPFPGCDMWGPVLDAPINPGNSGGPVCDLRGNVVGVVYMGWRARAEEETEDGLRILDVRFANNGLGLALDPTHVLRLLEFQQALDSEVERSSRMFLPKKDTSISREAYLGLQTECKRIGVAPFGPFCTYGDGVMYHGRLSTRSKVQLQALGWEDILERLNGGDKCTFVLQGREVLKLHLTKRRRWTWVVATRLAFT